MELYALKVFLTVATEEELFASRREAWTDASLRVSLAVQRFGVPGRRETDRPIWQGPALTDAGKIVLDYARRFDNLGREMETTRGGELRDNSAGRLIVGANESTSLYLLQTYRTLPAAIPKSEGAGEADVVSRIPAQLIDGDLELGVISYDPSDEHLLTRVILTPIIWRLCSLRSTGLPSGSRWRSRNSGWRPL